MNSTYSKAGGSAGSKGTQFQLNLVSIFLLNALRQNVKDWRLSTENKLAGKFDDLVFESSDGNRLMNPPSAILLQAKHKQNKKITLDQLLSTNSKKDDFSLPKYFLSYLEIRNAFAVKLLVVCTNTQADVTISKYLNINSVAKESLLHCKGDASFYTFNDNILPDLIKSSKTYHKINLEGKGVNESMITEENAKEFLEHLQFYLEYPSGTDLEQRIENLLSLNSINNLLDGVNYLVLHQKINDWFEQSRGEFLTQTRAKMMFCQIKSEKYLELLENYKVSFKDSNLKNIIMNSKQNVFHVVAKEGQMLHLLRVYYNLYQTRSKTLCVGCDYPKDIQEEIIKSFELPRYNFLIIASHHFQDESSITEICRLLKVILENRKYKKVIFVTEDNNPLTQRMKLINEFEYAVIDETLSLENLSDNTQEMLLKKVISFQGEDTSLGELLPKQITDKHKIYVKSNILEKLLMGDKFTIGKKSSDLEEETSIYYLNRKFEGTVNLKWNKNDIGIATERQEIFSEEDICNIEDKMIIISNSAGMGKTTALKSLAMKIKKNNPRLWVIRIELNRCTDILIKSLLNKKSIDVLELLSYNNSIQLNDNLENFLFLLKEEVILMLDGVDEISPDYTQMILDLLLQSQKEENFKKVFVTTRPHMAKELEIYLNVTSYKLVPLTEDDQIDFFTRYWTWSLKLDTVKTSKCEQYAKILMSQVSSWIREWQNEEKFIASPLHAKILAEVFQSKKIGSEDWEGCAEYLNSGEEEPKLPKTMNIVNLYEKFIDKKRNIFISKGNPTGNTIANQALLDQFEECLAYHRILALKAIFDDDCSFFSCYKYDARHDVEIILKMGIIQRVQDKLIFVHRTFAEYFVAESIFKELQLRNPDVRFQAFVIDKLFVESKYQIIRQYLNNLLNNRLPFPSSNIFKCYMSHVSNTYNSDLIHLLIEESNFEIIRFILHLIKFKIFRREIKKWSIAAFMRLFKKQNTLNIIKYNGGIDIKHDGLTPLHNAVFNGRLDAVSFLLEEGADVNCKSDVHLRAPNIYDWSINRAIFECYSRYKKYSDPCMSGGNHPPLHFAVARNWPHIIEVLLKHGADINIADNEGNTVVHFAAIMNDFEKFVLLVDSGANIFSANKLGKTALHFAAEVGNYDIVHYLAQHLNINFIDKKGNTALHFASDRNNLDIFTFLVKNGCDVNIVNDEGNTVLHISVLRRNFPMVKLLVEFGVNVNFADKKGDTALHLATLFNNFDMAEVLMGCLRVAVDIVNKEGNTALHFASDTNNLDIVTLLVKNGCDTNIVNDEGQSALNIAISRRNYPIVKLLIQHGANVNFADEKGNKASHLTWMRLFKKQNTLNTIKYGDGINIKHDGLTPLHRAVFNGRLDSVNFLLEGGADVNCKSDVHLRAPNIYDWNISRAIFECYSKYKKDSDPCMPGGNHPPLHFAVVRNWPHIIEVLLKHGADINIEDNEGNTVVHFAAITNDFQNFLYLVDHGANIYNANKLGKTALHFAAEVGNYDVVQYLAQHVNINFIDKEGNTALHFASDRNNLDIFTFLVKNGCDVNIVNDEGNTVLHISVLRRNFQMVKLLVEYGVNVNFADKNGDTALHLATLFESFDIVEVLMGCDGVDVNIANKEGNSALHLTVNAKNVDIIRICIGRGVNVNAVNEEGNTALHLATLFDSFNIVEFLMECVTVDVNIVNKKGNTALHIASDRNNLNIVRLLVKNGCETNIVNVEGKTVLHIAILRSNYRMVMLLVEHGANVNFADKKGNTALHLAILIDSFIISEVLMILCDEVDVNIANNEGNTALHLAINAKHFEIACMCIKGGVNINAGNNEGNTALHLALKVNFIEIIPVLIHKGADINIANNEGNTVVHIAAIMHDIKTFLHLVDHGANICSVNKSGKTALHFAAEVDNYGVARYLAGSNMNINLFDNKGNTALHFASERNNLEIATYLVKNGYDTNIVNNEGNTVLHIAILNSNYEMVKLFIEHGANLKFATKRGNTALHLAVQFGSINIVEVLMECGGIDVNIANKEGNTALHLAVDGQHFDIASRLIEGDVNINAVNKEGNTALHLAAEILYIEIIDKLINKGADINIVNKNGDTPLDIKKKYDHN